jgi:hypothetical protein
VSSSQAAKGNAVANQALEGDGSCACECVGGSKGRLKRRGAGRRWQLRRSIRPTGRQWFLVVVALGLVFIGFRFGAEPDQPPRWAWVATGTIVAAYAIVCVSYFVRGDRVMGVANLIFAVLWGSSCWPGYGSGVADAHGRRLRTGQQAAIRLVGSRSSHAPVRSKRAPERIASQAGAVEAQDHGSLRPSPTRNPWLATSTACIL